MFPYRRGSVWRRLDQAPTGALFAISGRGWFTPFALVAQFNLLFLSLSHTIKYRRREITGHGD
jgi:hypothetical protein